MCIDKKLPCERKDGYIWRAKSEFALDVHSVSALQSGNGRETIFRYAYEQGRPAASPVPNGETYMMKKKAQNIWWVGLFLVACGGKQPEPMSAAEHEEMAEHKERKADEKEQEGAHHVDWTPGPEAQEEIERYRALAAKHRAESERLRSAEASACQGIEDVDRDESPFVHIPDILKVEKLVQIDSKQRVRKDLGARITLRAVKGLTSQWVQRLIDCRIAANAALGYDVPEFPNDPLAVPDVKTRVTSVANGFAVEVTHLAPSSAREIQDRAQRLLGSAEESITEE